MNTSIPYSGFSAVPSDYDVNDGELSLSLNLIHEDGAVRPVSPPVDVLALRPDETLLVIHEVPGQKNYILARQPLDGAGPVDILWLKQSDDVTDTASAYPIASYGTIRDIASLGNTLVIASDTGLVYLLWKDDSYRQLGSRPPFISIDFGLYRVSSLSDSGTFRIPTPCVLNKPWLTPDATDAEWALYSQMAYSLLLPAIADNITSKGFFYQPFFVRYAYRLYDGSYSWHSAPILMLPTVLPPFILYSEGDTNDDGTTTAGFALSVPYFELAYRILSDGLDELDDWSDHVIFPPPTSGSGWPVPVLGWSTNSLIRLSNFLKATGLDFFHFLRTLEAAGLRSIEYLITHPSI